MNDEQAMLEALRAAERAIDEGIIAMRRLGWDEDRNINQPCVDYARETLEKVRALVGVPPR